MIIYGSRATHLTTGILPEGTCPSCQSNGTYVASVFARYAHVFWIPLFPIGKVTVGECKHCKRTLKSSEMPPDLQHQALMLQSSASLPKWTFLGLGLIGLLIVYGNIASDQHAKEKQAFLDDPHAGDIYHYKTNEGHYSLMKVSTVTPDSLYVFPNQYEIDKVTKLYKIDLEKNYAPEAIGITRKAIQEKYKAGDIFDIDRP